MNNKDNKTLLDILQKMKLGINLEAFQKLNFNFGQGANGVQGPNGEQYDQNELNAIINEDYLIAHDENMSEGNGEEEDDEDYEDEDEDYYVETDNQLDYDEHGPNSQDEGEEEDEEDYENDDPYD